MIAVRSSEDVFRYVASVRGNDADGDMDAIALFTYALVEQDRIAWLAHYKEQHKAEPDPDKIQQWFADKPEYYFNEKLQIGANWFAGFARALLEEEINSRTEMAIQAAIGDLSKKVVERTKLWPQFWVGNGSGITSNLLFGLIVVAIIAVTEKSFSFADFAKKIFGH